MRVLIAVTHLLGVGHLARAAALGRAFTRAGHQVLLASGGRAAPAIDLAGMKVLQLPSVHVKGTDFRTLYRGDGAQVDASYLAARQAMLVAAAAEFQPDAVIIELFPFGRRQLADEFQALIDAVRQPPFKAALFSSIRDVLSPPSSAAKLVRSHDLLGMFDGVLVHSDSEVMPLEESWPVTEALRRRIRYTGYVSDIHNVAPADRAGIIVSGGGSAMGLPLMRAALTVAAGDKRQWRVLAAHSLPEAEFAALQAAASPNVIVERARPDFPALLAEAECSISQFGYNTALDIAAAGTPAVVVPFDEGKEAEQSIRARRFAAMGLVEHLPSGEVTAESLRAAVERAVARGPQAARLDMRGAERAVAIVAEGVAAKQAEAAAWAKLQSALTEADAAGRAVRIWWRDDDAVAPTPELDRLLALAARFAAPLGLAAIPAGAMQPLAERLRGEAVQVLVHGISHTNNAQPGAKKQELVAADAETRSALRDARFWLEMLFKDQALPALAPPWNRIAPELVAALPQAGFAAWSGFDSKTNGQRAAPMPGQAAVAHTHIDPINWKGGGGLVSLAPLLERLAGLVAAQRPGAAPIGILTHHLVHDGWIWAFLETLFTLLAKHRSVRFVDASEAFALTSPPAKDRQA